MAFSLLLVAAFSIPAVSGLSGDAITCPAQWGPFLTNMTTGSVTVNWWTEQACKGTVSYREINKQKDGPLELKVTEEQSSLVHRIRLTNLIPNKTYSYAVSGDPADYTFRTFPENGTIRFVVYGDTREQLPWWNQSTHHALVASRIANEPDIRFVIHTGDLVNDPSDRGEWERFFTAAGPIMDHVPFYTIAGNHEGATGVIQEIFGVPPWYVISCGDVRVVVLDSNPLPPAMMAEQEGFISEIPGRDGNWTFVAIHHPMYSADPNHPGGFRDVRKKWELVFQSWGVRAVFAAHVHAYEHFERSGIHYFTVATGGAPSYQLSPEKPEGYITSRENTLGYAVVTVDSTIGSAEIDFVDVADIQDTTIRPYPHGTVYERVLLDKRSRTIPKWDVSRFPILFTSQFGDTKIKMLN